MSVNVYYDFKSLIGSKCKFWPTPNSLSHVFLPTLLAIK